MQSYLVTALTIAAVLGLYRLFSRIIPVSKSKNVTSKTLAQLKTEYMVFDLKSIGLTFLLSIVLIYLFYQLFLQITDFRTGNIEDAGILIKPDPSMLLLPALFAGLLAAAVLLLFLGKHQLKEKWSEYMAYYDLKYKFNYERGMLYFFRFVAVLVIPLTILSLDMFSSFGKHSIKFNGFLGLGTKTYNYGDVSGLTRILKVKAPNGDVLNEPHTVIRFKDGSEWSTRMDGFDDEQKNQEIVDLVVARTKKQIHEKEFAD